MKNDMMSLYDFLGKPAGSELGKEVYKKSVEEKVKISTREISNPKFEGKVMLYPQWFLEKYFSPNVDYRGGVNNDLPF